jgi:hypothetical protein
MSKDPIHRTEEFEIVVAAWKVAASAFGLNATIPYALDGEVECVGFLAEFGRPNGMIMSLATRPQMETDKRIVALARAKGMFWTFLNPKVYSAFNAEVFKEALTDWGYFGPTDRRPIWLD